MIIKNLIAKIRGVDLNVKPLSSDLFEVVHLWRTHHVCWQNLVRTAHGLFAMDNIFSNRRPLQWQSSSTIIQLRRAFSRISLCAINLSRKRGYFDFERLFTLQQAGSFFVTLSKSNTDYRRLYSAPSDRSQGILCDQTIVLSGFYTQRHYPNQLWRIRFKDIESNKTLVFLTNFFLPPATTICALYKARWQVELFFKWIKQHLRIKAFYGNSDNAVKTQIWIAVTVYVLIAIIKKRLGLDTSLYILLQIFSVTLFEKIPLNKDFSNNDYSSEDTMFDNQLNLFNF